jgi:hypothetical protein
MTFHHLRSRLADDDEAHDDGLLGAPVGQEDGLGRSRSLPSWSVPCRTEPKTRRFPCDNDSPLRAPRFAIFPFFLSEQALCIALLCLTAA